MAWGTAASGRLATGRSASPARARAPTGFWDRRGSPEEQAELLLENVDGALASAHELLATLRGAITTRDFDQAMRLPRLLRHRLDAIDSLCQQTDAAQSSDPSHRDATRDARAAWASLQTESAPVLALAPERDTATPT